MIQLLMRGRLGNQMFQYAAVRSFQQKYYPGEKLCLVTRDLKKLGKPADGFCNSLGIFHTLPYTETDSLKATIPQHLLMFVMRLYRFVLLPHLNPSKTEEKAYAFEKRLQPLCNRLGLYYMIQGYVDFSPTKAKNILFVGNFESSSYFDDNRSNILQEYTSTGEPNPENVDLFDTIQNTESVCVTIRRGDFVSNETFRKHHYICTPEYFYKSVDKLRAIKPNLTLIIFSDDIKWVRENMHFTGDVFYESGRDSLAEKLRLMSSCKHFIISNSTFSWWAQYLSTNSDKIVIAPSSWNHHPYKNKPDIYMDNWLIMDV